MVPASIKKLANSRMMTKQTANDVSANMATTATDPHAMERLNRLRAAADRLRSRDTIANKAGVVLGTSMAGAASPSGLNLQPPPVNQEEMQ